MTGNDFNRLYTHTRYRSAVESSKFSIDFHLGQVMSEPLLFNGILVPLKCWWKRHTADDSRRNLPGRRKKNLCTGTCLRPRRKRERPCGLRDSVGLYEGWNDKEEEDERRGENPARHKRRGESYTRSHAVYQVLFFSLSLLLFNIHFRTLFSFFFHPPLAAPCYVFF